MFGGRLSPAAVYFRLAKRRSGTTALQKKMREDGGRGRPPSKRGDQPSAPPSSRVWKSHIPTLSAKTVKVTP